MKRLKRVYKIGLHIILWLILIFLNYTFLGNFAIEFDFLYHFTNIIIYASIFYITFYFLMPLLYKKRVTLFIVFSLVLLSSALVYKNYVNKRYFEKRFTQYMDKWPFKPGFRLDFNPAFKPSSKPGSFDEAFRNIPEGNELNKRRIMFNAYGIFLFYILSFSARFIQKWQDDERHKSELEKDKIRTELSFLKQQINPHFLFNSLNSIYSLSISKSEITTDSILKLSSILRYMLYDSDKTMVYLKDELKTIHDYIELQKLRITNKVAINFSITGEPDDYKIEPFIIIPIIENAFKYGTDNLNDSFVKIMIKVLNQKLELKVQNKIVSKNELIHEEKGIGLKNIKRRLELLYPENHTFESIEENKVFSVSLEIKLKK